LDLFFFYSSKTHFDFYDAAGLYRFFSAAIVQLCAFFSIFSFLTTIKKYKNKFHFTIEKNLRRVLTPFVQHERHAKKKRKKNSVFFSPCKGHSS
jgi:hypothetical protein